MGPTEPLTWGMLKALIQREGITSNDRVGEFSIRRDEAFEVVIENGPFGREFSLQAVGAGEETTVRPDEKIGGSD